MALILNPDYLSCKTRHCTCMKGDKVSEQLIQGFRTVNLESWIIEGPDNQGSTVYIKNSIRDTRTPQPREIFLTP